MQEPLLMAGRHIRKDLQHHPLQPWPSKLDKAVFSRTLDHAALVAVGARARARRPQRCCARVGPVFLCGPGVVGVRALVCCILVLLWSVLRLTGGMGLLLKKRGEAWWWCLVLFVGRVSPLVYRRGQIWVAFFIVLLLA